ncbi:hypothetical protein ACFV8T_19410 [Streptomyces sp. NPDC059832]
MAEELSALTRTVPGEAPGVPGGPLPFGVQRRDRQPATHMLVLPR